MNKKLVFTISIAVLFIILSIGIIQAVCAEDYMEIESEWYERPSNNIQTAEELEGQYDYGGSNKVIINFTLDGIGVDLGPDYSGNLHAKIYELICNSSLDTVSNASTLKEEISELCNENDFENPEIVLYSQYDNDSFIVTSKGMGISMEPTLKSGSTLVLNKTHDVHEGDIVVADSDEHGMICKRVAKIDGNRIYLVSDNKGGTYESDGKTVVYEGVRTWVDRSDIYGVAIDVLDNDGVIRV